MKILVINCSPKGNQSDCLKLTNAFLEGMGEKAEIINAGDLKINSCIGCYSCWNATPGVCIHKDDMPELLTKLTTADLVIWSTPLYCYGMPAIGKAIVDRLLPLTFPQQEVAEDGSTYHPTRQENHTVHMLISGCGFANITNNYEGLLMQFGMTFSKDFPRILCVEAPLLSIPEAEPVALPYLELVKKAGVEFKENGRISDSTQQLLDTPMYDPESYRADIARGQSFT